MSKTTTLECFQLYVKRNFGGYVNDGSPDWRAFAIAACGAGGETGEFLDHFKKVIRDYNGDFSSYPAPKREEALLELGDALHYMVVIMQHFGFTLEEVMATNMDKLDKRRAERGKRKNEPIYNAPYSGVTPVLPQ